MKKILIVVSAFILTFISVLKINNVAAAEIEVVPNSGYVDNVYLNTNLGDKYIVSLIENVNLYTLFDGYMYVYGVVANNDKVIIFEKLYDDIAKGTMYSITEMNSNSHYWIYSEDLTLEEVGVESFGWQAIADSPIEINGEVIGSNEQGLTCGAENYKLTSLISTKPFNADDIIWYGATVPNSGYVSNVYINENLTRNQVYELVSNIEYIDYFGNHIYCIISDETITNALFIVKEDGPNGVGYLYRLQYFIGGEYYTYWYLEVDDDGNVNIFEYNIHNMSLSNPIAFNIENKVSMLAESYGMKKQNDKLSSFVSYRTFVNSYDYNIPSGGATDEELKQEYDDGYKNGYDKGIVDASIISQNKQTLGPLYDGAFNGYIDYDASVLSSMGIFNINNNIEVDLIGSSIDLNYLASYIYNDLSSVALTNDITTPITINMYFATPVSSDKINIDIVGVNEIRFLGANTNEVVYTIADIAYRQNTNITIPLKTNIYGIVLEIDNYSEFIRTAHTMQIIGYTSDDYEFGYNNGYSDGVTDTIVDVKEDPNAFDLYSKNQYDENFNSGFNSGYNQGLNEGYIEGANSQDFSSVMLTVFDMPIRFFREALDFDFFGINIYDISFSLLTLGIVIWLLKKFL